MVKPSLQHLLDMLRNAHFVKRLPFRTVLIDAWYASMDVMKAIEALSKVYCLVKFILIVNLKHDILRVNE